MVSCKFYSCGPNQIDIIFEIFSEQYIYAVHPPEMTACQGQCVGS